MINYRCRYTNTWKWNHLVFYILLYSNSFCMVILIFWKIIKHTQNAGEGGVASVKPILIGAGGYGAFAGKAPEVSPVTAGSWPERDLIVNVANKWGTIKFIKCLLVYFIKKLMDHIFWPWILSSIFIFFT